MSIAQQFNMDADQGVINHQRLDQQLQQQGQAWYQDLRQRCPYLYANNALFIEQQQLQQIQHFLDKLHQVIALPGWQQQCNAQEPASPQQGAFCGYDFHINQQGVHLIEINTNAGGGFFNALLQQSQQGNDWPGYFAGSENPQQSFVDMFQQEWQLSHPQQPLKRLCIVDQQPGEQYFYPEFILAQQAFQQHGIQAGIADPEELEVQSDQILFQQQPQQLIYNRLTDFSLQQHPQLAQAFNQQQTIFSPNPRLYKLYADKRNLSLLSNAEFLQQIGCNPEQIGAIQQILPTTRVIDPLAADSKQAQQLWQQRKQYFFKPATGYASKGTYRGMGITRRVFNEIIQGNYIAQQLAPAGSRMLRTPDAAEMPQQFKFDIRCYAYGNRIQLLAARVYRGQTTNFRTPGGGFTLVKVIDNK